jgi:hypothetical protein
MRLPFIFFLFLIAIGVSATAQQPPQAQPAPKTQPGSETDAQEQLNKTAAATIQWDKSTSPGVRAEVQPVEKKQADGRPLIQYRLKVTGAPHNKLYNLIAWPIMLAEPATIMEGLAIAADGTVGCPPDSNRSCAKQFKGAELRLTYTPITGEIFRHALISEDKQTRIFFTIVPVPIIEHDHACSLEAVRLSRRFELALIHGRGFAPGDQLSMHTESYPETHDSLPKVDPAGEFWAVLTPFVTGRTRGTTEVTVQGQSCQPKLSFDWGTE